MLNELAKEIHENAVAHGWWKDKRSFPEIISLIHSEVSEAIEEYRNGHGAMEVYYGYDEKPEGIPIELADVIIRHKLTVEAPCYDCIDNVDLALHKPNYETNFANYEKEEKGGDEK